MSNKESRKRVGKTLLVLSMIIVIFLCVIPLPSRIKDGGSLSLRPIVPAYSVVIWNGFKDEHTGTSGVTFELLGMTVYNSFHEVSR